MISGWYFSADNVHNLISADPTAFARLLDKVLCSVLEIATRCHSCTGRYSFSDPTIGNVMNY